MKTVVLLAARMGSSRFPGKTLAPIGGEPMIARMIERVRRSKYIDEIVVATTSLSQDNELEDFLESIGVSCFRGDATDVLGRITTAARSKGADRIVELLGDNPFVHSDLIDDVIQFFEAGYFDYAATVTNEYPRADPGLKRFPIGIRVQVFPRETLEKCEAMAREARHREHSTNFIYEHPEIFRLGYFQAIDGWHFLNRPDLTFAVNLPENLKMLNFIFDKCYAIDRNFGIDQVVQAFDSDKALSLLMGNDVGK